MRNPRQREQHTLTRLALFVGVLLVVVIAATCVSAAFDARLPLGWLVG